MTTTSSRTATEQAAATPQRRTGQFVELRWVTRHEWAWLWCVAAIGAVARVGGFSSGTLYRDDAWVALTTRVSLATAARMVVTTPGFVLGARAWIGWFPHTLWLEQLPTFVASVLGIVVVGRLARWWGLSAPASLVAAGLVAVAESDVLYATRVKPYAFDLLGACLVLWLAERCRRSGFRGAPWLAAASIAVCAISLTPVPLVLGVWVALGAEAAARRRLTPRLLGSAGVTAAGLLAADRVLHRPSYPGGDFRPVSRLVARHLAGGGLVVIGGTARWPWAYYDAHPVVILHSDLYNNGYYPVSESPRVIVIPGSAIEGGYLAAAAAAARSVRGTCRPVLYVEAGDWRSMPTTLLRTLTATGGLAPSAPRTLGGYRVWTLSPAHRCDLRSIAGPRREPAS